MCILFGNRRKLCNNSVGLSRKKWFNSKQLNMEYWKKLRIIKRCQEVCLSFSALFRGDICRNYNKLLFSVSVFWCPIFLVRKNKATIRFSRFFFHQAVDKKLWRIFSKLNLINMDLCKWRFGGFSFNVSQVSISWSIAAANWNRFTGTKQQTNHWT